VGENRMHGLMRGSNVLYRKEELDIRHGENYWFEWLSDVIPKNWRCRIMLSTLRHAAGKLRSRTENSLQSAAQAVTSYRYSQ